MSVLIKGMGMPKSCYYCPMTNNGFYLCKATCSYTELEDDREECRPQWCPLIEVPEHRCFEWIPVTERFPEKEGLYIVWVTWNDGLPDYSTVTYFDGDVFSCDGCVISHWMPLPEPPKEE